MKKITIFMLLACTFAILLTALAFADSIQTPSATGIINGTNYNLSVNATGGTVAESQITSCMFRLTSALSGISNLSVKNVTNTTTNQTIFNATFDSTINFQDANDYNVSASCFTQNGTSELDEVERTGVTLDNTVPDQASGLTTTEQETASFTISSTVNDAETTSCTLVWPDNNPINSRYPTGTAMTYSASTCSLALTSVPDYTYRWQVRASDETNASVSEIARFSVSTSRGGGGGGSVAAPSIAQSAPAQQAAEIVGKADGAISKILDGIANFFRNLFN